MPVVRTPDWVVHLCVCGLSVRPAKGHPQNFPSPGMRWEEGGMTTRRCHGLFGENMGQAGGPCQCGPWAQSRQGPLSELRPSPSTPSLQHLPLWSWRGWAPAEASPRCGQCPGAERPLASTWGPGLSAGGWVPVRQVQVGRGCQEEEEPRPGMHRGPR